MPCLSHVPFAAPVLIQLNAAGRRTGGNVGEGHSTWKSVNIYGPSPERGSVGCRERVHVVAEAYL